MILIAPCGGRAGPTVAGWLRGRSSSRNRLLVLGDVTIITGAGVRDAAVPIDHIVGSVAPTKCFDRHFRPTSQLPRTRFARIAADIYSGCGMDPVDLYQCGDQYYVLVGFQISATGLDLGFYAARSYSLMRPPRTGRRLIRSWERSAAGWSGRGGRS
ncbi:MAG: hypothetical protein ACLQDY_21835, partial [Streptosporangiaceae bacterium]